MGVGKGRGKSILFGEHFVVYGIPALAAGIEAETIAKVTRKRSRGWVLLDDRPAVKGYKEKKLDEQKVSIENVLKYCGIDSSKQGMQIEFGGDLTCASGVGASAASCVALARAINEEYNLGFDDEKINEAAYEGEKGYHGTPSGLDNTVSTYGGIIWYKREPSKPIQFERIKLDKPIYLVVASTGLTASTTEVVGNVRKKKDTDPDWFKKIAKEYEDALERAIQALKEQNLEVVGEMMNKNHELLQELTVSCKELDHLVSVARENGALGSKMTGTGRGGNMIALVKDEASRSKVAKALKDAGAVVVWETMFQ